MKIALYLINVILAISIIYQGSKLFTSKSKKETTKVKLERKATPKKSVAKVSVKKSAPPVDEVKVITSADIFNNKRNPAGAGFSGRVELSLVGTFKVGKNEGAIIVQKSNQRNPFMSMMGGPRLGGTPPMMPQGGGFRQRFALNNNNTQNQGTKQYVRVGETLSNGYTLAAITRTSATLTRNGEKMELELQDPSKNQNQNRSNRNRPANAQQQLQWAQLQTQRQLMYMMMNMQRNNNNNAPRQSNQGNRGRRR
jgi:hypothetical protein